MKDRWLRLCELASKEQDPERLLQLVVEINRLLDERNQNLNLRTDGSEGMPKDGSQAMSRDRSQGSQKSDSQG